MLSDRCFACFCLDRYREPSRHDRILHLLRVRINSPERHIVHVKQLTCQCSFFSGTLVSLPPTVAVTLSPSLSVIGVRTGMLLVPISAGLLFGNPIAGALLRTGWIDLQAFCGAVVALSGICVMVARYAKFGSTIRIKG